MRTNRAMDHLLRRWQRRLEGAPGRQPGVDASATPLWSALLVTPLSLAACDRQLSRWDLVEVESESPETLDAAMSGQTASPATIEPTASTVAPAPGPASASDTSGGGPPPAPAPQDPPPALDVTAPQVDAGSDLSANAPFVHTATVTDEQATSVLWQKLSGPGDLTIHHPTALQTTIQAAVDGLYEVRLTATDAAGNAASDSFQLLWDASPPTKPAGLRIGADAPGNQDSADDDATVYLAWNASSDGGVGVKDYTVSWYRAAACSGPAQVVPQIQGTSLAITGQDGDRISFTVTAFDALGQGRTSDCSGTLTVDLSAPPPLAAKSARRGTTVQTVDLSLTLPTVVSDYARLEIRRGAGAVSDPAEAPADCQAGTLVRSFDSFTPGAILAVTDDTGAAGRYFKYRVCIQDAVGHVQSSDVLTQDSVTYAPLSVPIQAKPHVIFVTNDVWGGDLGGNPGGGETGVNRADARCRLAAQAAVDPPPPAQSGYLTSEANWRAVLSDSTIDAKAHVIVTGRVRDQADQMDIAVDRGDLWDGSILTPVFFTELGGAGAFVWTGSDRYGLRHASTCADWTNGGAGSGRQGDGLAASDFNWLAAEPPYAASAVSCASGRSLYCISQPPTATVPSFTAAAGGASGDVQLALTPPTGLTYVAKVEIWRLAGATPPDAACRLVTSETLVKTLSPAPTAVTSWTDATGQASAVFSYRACVFDAQGNLLISRTASGTSG